MIKIKTYFFELFSHNGILGTKSLKLFRIETRIVINVCNLYLAFSIFIPFKTQKVLWQYSFNNQLIICFHYIKVE